MVEKMRPISIGIAWCLAWGEEKIPKYDLEVLQRMREALGKGEEVPQEVSYVVDAVRELEELEDINKFPKTLDKLEELTKKHPLLWGSRIGLVYGGATKIKQYVFEESKLPDIRGASALLDKINLIDLPIFFGEYKNVPKSNSKPIQKSISISQWLQKHFSNLESALKPELIIYSTGGNILAFCPPAFVDDLANAIEKRYTHQTLSANSCAVGAKFKPLEIRFGLLSNPVEKTLWLEHYHQNLNHPLIDAYFTKPDVSDSLQAFQERKSFNELVGKLASLFNQRRSGNKFENRNSRSYPPMFETHPYLRRDAGDYRSAATRAEELPNQPWFSETSARKRIVGQISKRDGTSQNWYKQAGFDWKPDEVDFYVPSWVQKFEDFLKKEENKELADRYYKNCKNSEEARSLIEIGNASKPDGFVAYIYADGNNMGGYIQTIQTPEKYQQFSDDIFQATEQSVYIALGKHLEPHLLKNIKDIDKQKRNGSWIHPFEILTIGGDDVMLIVPANQALAIAKTIGEEFEKILLKRRDEYKTDQQYNPKLVHRYHGEKQIINDHQCKLSMSTGVLIAADDTPIYYAEKLTNQLLKSAKKRAKELKKYNYYGGTVDFLVMKSVTMISSNISEFRSNGLTKFGTGKQKLKLYASPYTLHELGGILATAQALKDADFPKSQIYQIRSLLERGKQTAILNYRYFRVRLSDKNAQRLLEDKFEDAWCSALTNVGNLAPWIPDRGAIYRNLMLLVLFETCSAEQFKLQYLIISLLKKYQYETIWRELVDLYPFIEKSNKKFNASISKEGVL
ncbi:MAG: type III-B CRISPR-associated protein Cas10/Cmr2 [Calothrix sp. MO_192.B10]|nr:type III-B CRISPR-associated protein Cas10/Cmr2 [Calothrix sp. MO_192.B10]